MIYAGIIDDVVCEIDELKIVGTRYKVDESVWMSMVKNITAKKIYAWARLLKNIID